MKFSMNELLKRKNNLQIGLWMASHSCNCEHINLICFIGSGINELFTLKILEKSPNLSIETPTFSSVGIPGSLLNFES